MDETASGLLKFIVFLVVVVIFGIGYFIVINSNVMQLITDFKDKNTTEQNIQKNVPGQVKTQTKEERQKVKDSFEDRSERIDALKEVGRQLGGGNGGDTAK